MIKFNTRKIHPRQNIDYKMGNQSTLTFLHFTDLHYGLQGQDHLWPSVREKLKRDILAIISDSGTPIDLVLFSGDVVQRGSKEEFAAVEEQLLEFQEMLLNSGSNPKWLFVPGNHDLDRPKSDSTAVIAARNWEQSDDFQSSFWKKNNNDLRKSVSKSLRSYESWLANTKLPILDHQSGLLPGDFSARFTKDDWTVGIIGLNSTFLQLAAGNFEGKLALSPAQLTACCDPDPEKWIQSNDANILMTHQPKSWLTSKAKTDFSSEIHGTDRFALHVCGHLHESTTQRGFRRCSI